MSLRSGPLAVAMLALVLTACAPAPSPPLPVAAYRTAVAAPGLFDPALLHRVVAAGYRVCADLYDGEVSLDDLRVGYIRDGIGSDLYDTAGVHVVTTQAQRYLCPDAGGTPHQRV
ncbi:MAG: DUF732 domain-containing protein [Pseudonocardia sp.]|nr:DUF732 domain-containing protein [Pseudonocardia sp.]